MSILAANGRLNLDTFSTEFIKTFWAPSAVTIGWLIQYGMVDAICVGASRNYFKWGFPKGAEGAPDPLRRAMRVHMNQAENSMTDSCVPTRVRLRIRLSEPSRPYALQHVALRTLWTTRLRGYVRGRLGGFKAYVRLH
ncbi:hypothetical protein FOZ63_004981, partial [Perkinsus olseni]